MNGCSQMLQDVGPGSLVCSLGAISRLRGRKGLSVQGKVKKKDRLKKGLGGLEVRLELIQGSP